MRALNVSPIVERELRVALRQRGLVKARMHKALIAAGLVVLFLLLSLVTDSRSLGRPLHTWLLVFGFYLAIYPAIHASVGLFSQERDEQTLQLLYLTGLRPFEIFMGKLLGGLLVASSELLALAPFLAVPFFMGGVSLDVFVGTVACLPVILIFVVAVGVLASVAIADEGAALMGAFGLIAALVTAVPVPFFLGLTLTGKLPFSADWLCLSPAYGPFLVATHFSWAQPADFWQSQVITLLWAAACVCLAAALLRRNGRASRDSRPWFDWGRRWQEWVYGSPGWRTRLRSKVLPDNPFQWLVERDRRPLLLCWMAVAILSLLWLICWWVWPQVWPSPTTLYLVAALILLTLNPLMTHAAARRIGQDRRDGQLELLLTTPLATEEIVDGQVKATRAQFRPLQYGILGLFGLMILGGYYTRNWDTLSLVNYLLIWGFLLGWCLWPLGNRVPMAMWIAINSGRPMFAVSRNRGNLWGWIWIVFNGRSLYRTLAGQTIHFPTGTMAETGVIAFILFVVIIILMVTSDTFSGLGSRLAMEMRSIAQEPVPAPNDPRFKNWNLQERLPGSAHNRMTEFAVASQARAEAKALAGRLERS